MGRVRRFIRDVVLLAERSPEAEAAFQVHANDFTARVSRAIMLLGPVCAFLWWPTDFLIFPHDPEMRFRMLWWRTGTVLTLGPGPLLITLSDRVRRRPVPVVTVSIVVGGAMLSYGVSRLGPATALWSGALYLLPLSSLIIQVSLVTRLAITTLIVVVDALAFFLPDPASFAPPAGVTIIAVSVFVALISTTLGHSIHRLVRVAFFANQRLEEEVRRKTVDLRSLAERLENLREQERTEIARELHDDVGQVLAAIRYEVDMFGKRARNAHLAIDTDDIHFLIDRMLDTFRRIVRALRPRALDDFGFVAAAEWLVNEHRQRMAIDITLHVTPPDLLIEGGCATAAYRVLQEALTNVARYAQASRVVVEIGVDANELHMTVTDNGRGLPPRTAWRTDAVGIIGMRERAHSLGGEAEVGSAAGGGTRVALRLPLPADTRRAAA